MEIRDAMPADAAAVAAVARESWHAAYDDLLGADTVAGTVDDWYDVDALREEIRETATAAEVCFLVADSDGAQPAEGRVVGFSSAGPARDRERAPDDADAFLSRLYVAPDHWGAGIGTELVGTVARRLRAAGHERVWLELFDANDRGRRFYESLGFERVECVTESFDGTDVRTLHLSTAVSALVDAPSRHE